MSMFLEARTDIVAYVNKKGGTKFTVDDFRFSAPQAQAQGAAKNTKVRLTLRTLHPTFQGSVVFDYNRLDLVGFSNIPTPFAPPSGTPGQSVYTLLQKIRNAYGVFLTQDDLEDVAIQDDGANGRVLLKAKANSHGWIGEYLLVLAAKPALSTLFTRGTTVNWS